MTFASIDIETTGLNPFTDQILEFGCALVKDWKIVATFRKTIWHENVSGSPYALALNRDLLQEIADCNKSDVGKNNIIFLDNLAEEFNMFLLEHGISNNTFEPVTITVAGKNFGSFDNQFLKQDNGWNNFIKVRHRTIDPAILYFDNSIDSELPSLEKCKKRSGLFFDNSVKHRADKDAEDVANLIINKLAPIEI